MKEEGRKNYVFLGEAGSGKSETALHFAMELKEETGGNVHFFDMDMTKPLFRSRDVRERLTQEGICFHYEEQFADAPTMVGGVRACLRDPDSYVVMDVGGDYIGARAVGEYAPFLNRDETQVFFVINAFRPWSMELEQIDRTFGEILAISHIRKEQIAAVINPHVGPDTTEKEFFEGFERTRQLIGPYLPIRFACAMTALAKKVRENCPVPVMELEPMLRFEEI